VKIIRPLHYHDCQSTKIKKNGKKYNKKQNYLCKVFGHKFIRDHALTYNDCHSKLKYRISKTPVRSAGIRDIAAIEEINIKLSPFFRKTTILLAKRILLASREIITE
jgi:transposase-like protein